MGAATANRDGYRVGRATYGSVAYDLNYLDNPAVRTREPAAEPHRAPLTKERSRTQARARAQARQSVSPLAVVGFVTAALLLILVMFSYIRLTEISDSVVKMQGQVTQLKSEEAALLAQYESAFDLSSIEQKATEAGMSKPQSGQVFYVDLSEPDRAVTYNQNEKGEAENAIETVMKAFSTLVEYFK